MGLWKRMIAGLSESGKQAEALRHLRPMMTQAHSLINAEEYEKGREILLKAIDLRHYIRDARTIDWLLSELAWTWLLQEKFDEQIAFLSDYVRRYPPDVAAYRERATAFWYLGRFKDALSDYSHAVELNPTDLLSRSRRGQVLAELGESGKAIDDLDMALRLLGSVPKPNQDWMDWSKESEAFIRRGRGVALHASGQIEEAMSEFERSIGLNSNNAWVYYSRAQAYDRIGDHQRAVSDYRSALTKTKPRLAPHQKERAQARLQSASS